VAVIVLSVLGRVLGIATGHSGAGGEIVPGAALVVLGLAVVAVAVVLRAIGGLGPTLDDLAEAAERLESGDYAARVEPPATGPRGLVDLVRGFNTMAARLEADEAQRRTLLADVSHELRTPLAVIHGTLEAILDGVYPADAAHLEPLIEETRVLTRLADDLRTVALADAGTLALHREPTDLGVLVADVVASFRAAAAAGDVSLTSTTVDDLPLVEVDPVRIREVLDNVVANALRHTPAGGSVAIAASRPDPATLDIRVRDTGPGIPPELLPHVFERFAKDPASRGAGLGLAIARGLVEAHGGSIAAESAPAAGTTIVVRLPLRRAGGGGG
jgi:two-component system sensor histidine kinase BaeS